jgi:RNA methyltransferase, TrmH family
MKLLTLTRDLHRRKARERLGLFVAEGIRTAEELLRSELSVEGALIAPSLAADPRGAALRDTLDLRKVPIQEVSESELASAADTESPQGVLIVARAPDRQLAGLAIRGTARLLVLDGLQDPGNVGTIVRTAAAFGVEATLSLPGTVDQWNAKVVRSAMGALFRHPVISATWDDLDEFLRRTKAEFWGTDGGGDPVDDNLVIPPVLALAVGNEGAGLSEPCRTRVKRLIGIPLTQGVESLNVAVATGIILHRLRS